MKEQFRLTAAAGIVFVSAAVALSAAVTTAPKPALADDCPNGGTIRFGVEPYDTAARLVPIYEKVGKLIGDKLGCKVKVYRRHQLQRRDRGDAQRQARDR